MKHFLAGMALLLGLAQSAQAIEHYLYYSHREEGGSNIRKDKNLQDPRFKGAQIVYTWRSLEPREGVYDFSAIRADLAWLQQQDKRLWIQLQDKSFSPRANVPAYLLTDPRFHGGALRQSMLSAPERDPAKPEAADDYGWVPMMWQPEVRARFQALIRALGQEFDGKIAGINFSESAIDIGTEHPDGSTTFPAGFEPANYVAAIGENMEVLAQSFPNSTAMVYLNFLPDEWLPWNDKGYMRGLFARAEKLGMGVGGPDLMPYRKSHMAQSYALLREYPDKLVKGMAVQDGNLRQTNPKTGRKNTVGDIVGFATDYLGLDYIFWVEEEPYFSREVLRELR